MTNEQEQRGRIAFEAFWHELGRKWPWELLRKDERGAWIAAAAAVYQTTLCHFDLEGQKSANSHAPKVTP